MEMREDEEDKENVVMRDVSSEPKDYWFSSSMIDAFLSLDVNPDEGSTYQIISADMGTVLFTYGNIDSFHRYFNK
jgi:hypothetical protein